MMQPSAGNVGELDPDEKHAELIQHEILISQLN